MLSRDALGPLAPVRTPSRLWVLELTCFYVVLAEKAPPGNRPQSSQIAPQTFGLHSRSVRRRLRGSQMRSQGSQIDNPSR